MGMSHDVTLRTPFDAAIERVTAALKQEGFGVLTRVDIDAAFREKIGKEFRRYAILGACNPPIAFRALSARPEVGLLLPCNVTVEEVAPGECLVRVIDAREMMKAGGFDGDPALAEVGKEADERLRRVADALRR
jgi:uncharacterized protein (DUF302 family)